jgi:hypothetical protein
METGGGLIMPRADAPATEPAEIPIDEWPLQARLRLEHSGKWVAWSEDGSRIVAAADDYEAVRTAARQAGVERAICEWLPPLDQARSVGGV